MKYKSNLFTNLVARIDLFQVNEKGRNTSAFDSFFFHDCPLPFIFTISGIMVYERGVVLIMSMPLLYFKYLKPMPYV